MSLGGLHWMIVPIVGMPGTECGRGLGDDSTTFATDFPNDGCTEHGRWMCGYLFLCEKHAAWVAEQAGDNIEDIRAAIREQY